MTGPRRVRLATWNVNSLSARLPRVEEWISYARPDILCMQETKLADASFPAEAFSALGYESAHHGDGRWNGVAILSRIGLSEVATGLGSDHDQQGSRLLAADCGGIRVHSVYVPNGRSLDSEHYTAKLAWLARLRTMLEETAEPSAPVAVCGDFNVAPDDRDVYDPAAFVGSTHVSGAEREALARLEEWGLVDVFRRIYGEDRLFTWWDYRAGNFHKHLGMRIDLVLVTETLARSATYALIDRNARKGSKPSDHSPLFVDLELPA
ncbi:MAG TPA: exodeoxyribonuclease III [Acidimicrobiales bacterium]|nr:exodeoxyribonuclease III [Acidimicrobiales bacterium]